jgi:sarcosine oxidase
VGTSRHVVIGAGLAGAATAFHLARRGHETTVVERSCPAAPDGSSHGSARILRFAYADPFYAGLVVRSEAGFDELERLTGRQLLRRTGALDHGALRGTRQLAQVLQACGVEHELVPVAEADRRWPGFAVEGEVLWQPGAGVVDAEATVHALLGLAEQHGAQVLQGWPVAQVESLEHSAGSAARYRLDSDDGRTLEAASVVVAAGAWLPDLLRRLPLPLSFVARMPALRVSQEQVFHFPHRAAPGAQDGPMPTSIHHREDILAYSLPGGRDAGHRGQKVAEMNGGRQILSAADQDGVVDPANRRRVVRYVERHLPGLVPEPYAETTCLFTSTPTEDFVIDRVDGITLVSACSGHGAKFTPLIGEVAADVATGGPGLDRFRLRSPD